MQLVGNFLPFRSERRKKDYLWKKSTISKQIFQKNKYVPFHVQQDFLLNGKHPNFPENPLQKIGNCTPPTEVVLFPF